MLEGATEELCFTVRHVASAGRHVDTIAHAADASQQQGGVPTRAAPLRQRLGRYAVLALELMLRRAA